MIKLLCCDVDGTMTDGSIFLDANGVESKRFDCRDGAGFHRLKEKYPDIKIAMITSEKGGVNQARYEKFKETGTVDYFYDGIWGSGKSEAIKDICNKESIKLCEVAYIGDDLNDLEALKAVGFPFCPEDSKGEVLILCVEEQLNTYLCDYKSGHGAVRECCERIIKINEGMNEN